jgi:hypothetical protein
MAILKQSTAYARKFLMVLSSDHITGATGLAASIVVKLSKGPGAAGTTAAGAVTELDATNLPGMYQVSLTSVDTNTNGDLGFDCSVATCDHTTFVDQVQATIFTDLMIDGTGRVYITSNYKQNQTALLPFTMTVGNPPVATAGLAPVGQRNFGSGYSSISGAITDLGNGAYLASLLATDTNAAVAYYHFTSTVPNANEQDITVFFQP